MSITSVRLCIAFYPWNFVIIFILGWIIDSKKTDMSKTNSIKLLTIKNIHYFNSKYLHSLKGTCIAVRMCITREFICLKMGKNLKNGQKCTLKSDILNMNFVFALIFYYLSLELQIFGGGTQTHNIGGFKYILSIFQICK